MISAQLSAKEHKSIMVFGQILINGHIWSAWVVFEIFRVFDDMKLKINRLEFVFGVFDLDLVCLHAVTQSYHLFVVRYQLPKLPLEFFTNSCVFVSGF